MSDKEWVEEINQIDDPKEMLQAIVDYQDFLGYDPYFRDLRATLLNNAERILKENHE